MPPVLGHGARSYILEILSRRYAFQIKFLADDSLEVVYICPMSEMYFGGGVYITPVLGRGREALPPRTPIPLQ